MGLLFLGTPLDWDEAKQYADHVRTHGITQFLHIWDRLKDRCGDELLWGDEVLDPLLAASFLPWLLIKPTRPPPCPRPTPDPLFLAKMSTPRTYCITQTAASCMDPAREDRVHGRGL